MRNFPLYKRISIGNSILFLICLCSTGLFIAYEEMNRPNLVGQNLVEFLQKSNFWTKSFLTTNEHMPVSAVELYDPYPSSRVFSTTPFEVLQATRKYEKSCNESTFEKADSELRRRGLSPSKLLDWHRSLCTKNFAGFKIWLNRAPFIHPSGKSYALLFKNLSNLDKNEVTDEVYMHVKERTRLNEFDRWFVSLSISNQLEYLKNFQILSMDSEIAVSGPWNGSSREILVFSLSDVQRELKQVASIDVSLPLKSTSCELFQYNLCFSKIELAPFDLQRRWLKTFVFGFAAFLFLSLSLSYIIWNNERRRIHEDQALLFQIIAHEFRTPMTGLKLNLTALRSQFDIMNEDGQQNLLKTLEAVHDLEKILSRTLMELKRENQRQVFDVVESTARIIENRYESLVAFKVHQDILKIKISEFWYEICISNLIRNALLYGEKPIEVSIEADNKIVQVIVQDSGGHSIQNLIKFRSFFAPKSTKGLGLGLKIVERKLDEVNAKLEVFSAPTRYVLVFPRQEVV